MIAPVQQCQPGSESAVARYVEMRRRQPLSQLNDVIHAIHTGTEYEAELRLSDIAALKSRVEELTKALETVKKAYEDAPGWAAPTPTTDLVWKMYVAARDALAMSLEDRANG